MEKRTLLPSQMNEIFSLVQQIELNHSDFEWRERVSSQSSNITISDLVHKSTGFYFLFDYHPTHRHYSQCSPGEDTAIQQQISRSWETQKTFAKTWLHWLKREIESPDLWGSIARGAEIAEAAASNDTENISFNENEKQYIATGINEIKEYLLKAHDLSERNATLVAQRLDYLIEASNRVGRKDWINLLLSVLVGIVISAALPPDSARELFSFAGQVLHQILHSPLLLSD
jgi:hypothetical protein